MSAFDTIIKNGTIVDGTRLPRFRGDIGVKDGRITEIGTIRSQDADTILDASGLIVAPGFIDTHTHYDGQIYWDPYCTGSGWHGVTTVVIGNCGFGFAPVKPTDQDRAMLMMSRNEQIPFETLKAGLPWDWSTYPEFLDSIERTPKGVNCASMVPISPIMVWAMGLEGAKSGRPPTDTETAAMQGLLREGLDAGGIGWGIQRLGEFSNQADFDGSPMPTDIMGDELIIALCEATREQGSGTIQMTEAVFPDPELLTSGALDIIEALVAAQEDFLRFEERVARVSERPVVHNIVVPVDGIPDVHQSRLRWLEQANAEGLRLYGQGNTIRNILIFKLENFTFFDSSKTWASIWIGNDKPTILARLADPDLRARLHDEEALLVKEAIGGSIENVTVHSVNGNEALQRHVGRKVGDIAAESGRSALDTILDLTLEGELDVEFKANSFGGTDPGQLGEVARSPYVIPGISDGGAHTKFLVGASYPTELLAWLVRDEQQLTLEDAHWHLSHLPAHVYGVKDRGALQVGAAADIVMYDLAELAPDPVREYEIAFDLPAGEWRRIQRARGYRWIMVNGTVTFEDGVCTDETPGALLRHGAAG